MTALATPPPGSSALAGTRFFVTGATGTVGAAVVERCASMGAEVTATTRALKRVPERLRVDPRITWREIDVLGDDTVVDLSGYTHVVHSAADVRWNRPLDEARWVNTEFTRRLVDAATAVDGLHFIQVSTAYVAQREGEVGFKNTYEQSKAEAEQVVHDLMGAAATIVRPTLVVGDEYSGVIDKPKGLYLPLALLYKRDLPFVVGDADARIDIVSSTACADAIVDAALAGPSGKTIVVAEGDDAGTAGQIFERICVSLGRHGFEANPPAFVKPRTWDRFYGPLMQEHAPTRSDRIRGEAVEAFAPYMSSASLVHVCGDCAPARPVRPFASYVDQIVDGWLGRSARRVAKSAVLSPA